MAPRIKKGIVSWFRQPHITRRVEIAVFVLILLIFSLKISGYLHWKSLSPVNWAVNVKTIYDEQVINVKQSKYFGACPVGQIKIDIGKKYLCRDPIQSSLYQKIYDTYPRAPDGREVIYPSINNFKLATANDFLKNQYDIERYKPASLSWPLTWTEDPYQDQYWRFNFYSLRIFNDLLKSYETSGNPVYANKLEDILNSFLITGYKQPHAWDDFHAVAWRSIMLTEYWWQLRQQNHLPIQLSNKLLQSIEMHGQFMMDPHHYEAQYNHGVNEAAALYMLGVNFPNLKGGNDWLATGKSRLAGGLNNIFDDDGALIEHSPYYNFYALQKYWDIYTYSDKYNQHVSPNFDAKIKSMINYATYILMPNDHVPLIGSSLDTSIHSKDEYAQMGNFDPHFKFATTEGKEGKAPPLNNVAFHSTGQTIMRSGWDRKAFTQQTQVIFNYGSYITHHSHLDSLSFTLYGGGISLLPGSGLYSYNPGPMKNYFFGTASQNTVMVDGKNQNQGSAYEGKFTQGKSYVAQSAAHQLYDNTTHERYIAMLGRRTIIVIDKLTSDQPHTYQQLFHVFPGAKLTTNGLDAVASGSKETQRLEIRQVAQKGVRLSDIYNQRGPNNIGGICSIKYQQLLPCHQLTYSQKGKTATFITILQIGKPNQNFTYNLSDNNQLYINDGSKKYNLSVAEIPGVPIVAQASDPKAPRPLETVIDDFSNPSNWQLNSGNFTPTSDSYQPSKPAASLATLPTSHDAQITKQLNLNLVDKNLLLRLKLPNSSNVRSMDLLLYTDKNSYVQNRLINSYDNVHDNDQIQVNQASKNQNNGWATISLGKGSQRPSEGQWSTTGSNFSWSHITSISFRISSANGLPVQVYLGQLSTIPAQKEAKVVIIFDDGSSSILPAVQAMSSHGFLGNIAVIGKYPTRQSPGYLSFDQLRSIQAKGWTMVNHSYDHQDAVARYYDTNDMIGFESDILTGAKILNDQKLDTDANWYIYPHGTTNQAIQAILAKYYKFARTELTAPEVYPFGNPLAVKDFIVFDKDTPQDVFKVINDAKTYKTTQILTFHKINAYPTDNTGYPISSFISIMDYLKKSGIPVMSLRQLDQSNGVSINKLNVKLGHPNQLDVAVVVQNHTIWHGIGNVVKRII